MDTLRRFCVWLGLLLVRLGGQEPITVPTKILALVPAVRLVCAEIEARAADGTSGEFKRHTVLARLQKAYPGVPARHLALAIELAIGS